MSDDEKKLGLVGLTAIVFGSMIGSGIFNIVQNMSAGASAGAVIISWIITAVGMSFLVLTFKTLSDLRPDLNAGIYQYAQIAYGDYVGFNVAWGYWLCTAFANVAFAVMLNDSLGVFFPVFLEHGWASALFGTGLIWSMYFIVGGGIHSASVINVFVTSLKIASLCLIVCIVILYFNIERFSFDFWGRSNGLGPIDAQVRRTMMASLWCFIGIEGAVVMAARAKRARDVSLAGIMGLMLAWTLYALVSVLAYGVMPQQQMAGLENPSVAYLLKDVCGEWAYYFVIISVIGSLLGGWIAWTLICAQVPYEAAMHGVMPRQFLKLNKNGVPTTGLLLASVIMQVFYLGVLMAESVYNTAIEISGMMVLPAYLFSGLFLVKAAWRPVRYLHTTRSMVRYRIIAVVCSLYCLWLIYSGGVSLMLATSLFYLPGAYFFIKGRREHTECGGKSFLQVFTRRERWVFIAFLFFGVVSLLILE